MPSKSKPVALDVWLHQEQEKAWRKEREIREIAHQKRQAEREIARQKRQAERAAAAAERRATRHAVVRALEASLRQDKEYRFGVQPCPWYALYGDCKSVVRKEARAVNRRSVFSCSMVPAQRAKHARKGSFGSPPGAAAAQCSRPSPSWAR